MTGVSTWLTRGVFAAVLLLPCGRLSDSTRPPVERALETVRAQDYAPLFELAGRRLDEYFRSLDESRFIDEIFSLSGKWKALTRGRESYERFVRKTFEKHLVNPGALEGLLGKIRADYDFLAEAHHNRLLVALYRDVGASRRELTFEGLRGEFDRLAAALAPDVLRDLGMNLVSIAGSDAAAVVLVSSLTSAGILGGTAAAGASGAFWTFGVSLVAGVVAGFAIDAIVGDSHEEAARAEIRAHLSALRNRIINAVYDSLSRAVAAHRRLLEKCVRALYEGGPDGRLAGGR